MSDRQVRPSAALRRKLEETTELLVAPVCLGPLTARIADMFDFPIVYVGGYTTGAWVCTPEPLLGRSDMVEFAGSIARRTASPVVVDANAGFGEPMHAAWTVRELIAAGISGAHIEDQAFPKRAHYHRDYQEHVISTSEMREKIAASKEATSHDDAFLLIARTDAMRTNSYEEGVRRCNDYLAAGADVAMCFPNDLDEAKRAPRDIDGPTVYTNSWGNRVGRPILTTQEAAEFGYRILIDAQGALLAAVSAVRAAYEALASTGSCFSDAGHGVDLRRDLERIIGLEELYALEATTVERVSI